MNMIEIKAISLMASILLAVASWWVVSYLNSSRDRKNKKRELVVTHLVDAYRVLTQEIGRRETTPESMTKFENLMTEIQLFGSREQVEMAKKISKETAENGVSEIDPLIEVLRSNLRRELNLEELDEPTIWLRFTENFKPDKGKTNVDQIS